ncbi:MAG: TolC family protein [Gammaproteobacteria bacterium]
MAHSNELLPEPLTLKFALGLSKNINPDLAFKLAEKDRLTSTKLADESEHGFNVFIEGQLDWYERSTILIQKTISEEHKVSLRLTKPIYDFGSVQHKLDATDRLLDSNALDYQNEIYIRQVKILEAYFNVLLSDLIFNRHNENMAISFIEWDRTQKRNKLGTTSELDVEKKHSEYQRVRRERFESENNQRRTRNRLAVLMNTNGNLPLTLEMPKNNKRVKLYPAVDELVKKAFENNLTLKSIRKRIDSVRKTIKATKSQMMPQIDFVGETSAYASKLTLNSRIRENWNVAIVVGMPLYDSGKMDSEVAKIRAEIYQLESLLRQTKETIQDELLSLKLKLDTLRFERDEANAFSNYSELLLDEKRALYEMEVKTTLGTAMVQATDAEYGVAKVLYETLLTWARIDILVGEEPAINIFK